MFFGGFFKSILFFLFELFMNLFLIFGLISFGIFRLSYLFVYLFTHCHFNFQYLFFFLFFQCFIFVFSIIFIYCSLHIFFIFILYSSFFNCILAFDPAKNAIQRWCTGREVTHSNGSYERKSRVSGNWLMKWDEVKKFLWYTHRLMHRKRVTCELHDSYFRLMTIQHAIPKIE